MYRDSKGIPQNITIKNLEDPVIKIFKKKKMIVACHRLGKTTKTTVKLANRKDADLFSKIKKS